MPIDLAVTGATGRMGRAVLEVAADRDDCTIALAVSPNPPEGPIEGVPVESDDQFGELLVDRSPDAVVDFTAPDGTVTYAEACREVSVPIVSGTTGFTNGQLETLRAASEDVPVLWASNFSRGIAALRRAVEAAVAALPSYDVELTETHHNGKVDAPSGTAKTLLEDIERVRGDEDAGAEAGDGSIGRVHGRAGHAPRSSGEIGVHARRAGDIAGEHEVLLAGNDETIQLTHRAGDRRIFATGAIDAAVWIAGRGPGWYTFDDVIDYDPTTATDGGSTTESIDEPTAQERDGDV